MKQENKFLIVAGIFVIALVIGHYQFGLFSITGVVGDVKISYQSMQPGCVVRLDRLGEATFVGVYDVASQGKKNADMASKIGWITNETYSDAITFLRDHPPDSSCVAIGAEHQCEIGDSKCCGNTNIHCIDGTGNIQFICEPLSGNGSLWVNYGPSTSCFSCTPSWQTGSWSTCTSGTQTRTVTDSNNCGTTEGKPATTQTCTVTCTPDNSCQATTCTTSTCTNNCGTVLQGTKDCSVCTSTTYYRFSNNACSSITICAEQKTSNDYITLTECQSKIIVTPNKTLYYRLSNNTCSTVQLLPSEVTTSDYTTMALCQSHITTPTETPWYSKVIFTLGTFGVQMWLLLTVIGGAVLLVLLLKK